MAKTADVAQSIWADPWFRQLPPDSKLLYFWAITTPHGNLAGLFVAAQDLIESDTKLTPSRFKKALEQLDGKMIYDEATSTIWVAGRVKYARTKSAQIAKSIVRAVEECQVPEIQAGFMAKYGDEVWLGDALGDSALLAVSREPHPSLSEAPSQSQSQGQSQSQRQKNPRDAEWAEWLADYREVTGHDQVTGSSEARRFFDARRKDGRSMADLKVATRGAHSDQRIRDAGFDRPETILRESRIERYIGLGRKLVNGSRRDERVKRAVLQ